MKTKFYILVYLLFVSGFSFAQQMQRVRFDVAEYKLKQAEHVTKELDLTQAEAKAFIPLMNEYTDKKFEINRAVRLQSRTLRNKPNATQAEYSKALDDYLDSRVKEAELEKEYYTKFKAVLPVDKVYKFERVERKFNEKAISKFKERNRNTEREVNKNNPHRGTKK